MEERTLAVLKQPTASTIVRGVYYALFGALMIVVTILMAGMSRSLLEDAPYFVFVPVAGALFLVMGIGDIVLAAKNTKLKENPVVVRDGKLRLYGHILATPLFTEKKTIELDASKLNARYKRGNRSSTSEWWKLYVDDPTRTVKVRIMKFLKGDIRSLVDAINGAKG
jgi:hypothetical protein